MSGRYRRPLAAVLLALSAGACAPRGKTIRQDFPRPVLGGLGKHITIREEAATWEKLVGKLKPTFTWNGRDMMWISEDEKGNPLFTMDRAYEYRSQGRPGKRVLITAKGGPPDKWYAALNSCSLRGVAKLREKKPTSHHGCGEYAVVKEAHPKYGTVYEVGWQSLMAFMGTSLAETGRRLYVLRDRDGKWRFIGEGLTEGSGKMGYCHSGTSYAKAAVEWTGRRSAPVRIRLTVTNVEHEWRSSDDLASKNPSPPPRRNRVELREYVLEGPLPAKLRLTAARPYMLAGKDDTLEGIARHLASWTGGWGKRRRDNWRTILESWRVRLAEINPGLGEGRIPAGKRVWLPTRREREDTEVRLRFKSFSEPAKRLVKRMARRGWRLHGCGRPRAPYLWTGRADVERLGFMHKTYPHKPGRTGRACIRLWLAPLDYAGRIEGRRSDSISASRLYGASDERLLFLPSPLPWKRYWPELDRGFRWMGFCRSRDQAMTPAERGGPQIR